VVGERKNGRKKEMEKEGDGKKGTHVM